MNIRAYLPALLALSICISCTKIEGSITSTGDALGNWTLKPEKCMTGDRERTVGASLYTEADPTLFVKIVKDIKQQTLVFVSIPSTCTKDGRCQATMLQPVQCAKLSANVKLTNIMTPDDFREADGNLELDCRVFNGRKKGRIRGRVTFENCD